MMSSAEDMADTSQICANYIQTYLYRNENALVLSITWTSGTEIVYIYMDVNVYV